MRGRGVGRGLVVVFVASLLLQASVSEPALAATAFADPAGDATGADPLPPPAPFVIESTPRPNEPELDILGTGITSDGARIVFTVRVAKVGALAVPTAGVTFRLWFTYDSADYQIIVQRADGAFTTTTTTGVFLRSRVPQSPELSCRDCTARFEVAKSQLTVSLPLTGLSTGIRQSKPASPKLGPGAKLGGLMVLAQRLMAAADRTVDVGRTVTVDVARGGPLVLVL